MVTGLQGRNAVKKVARDCRREGALADSHAEAGQEIRRLDFEKLSFTGVGDYAIRYPSHGSVERLFDGRQALLLGIREPACCRGHVPGTSFVLDDAERLMKGILLCHLGNGSTAIQLLAGGGISWQEVVVAGGG